MCSKVLYPHEIFRPGQYFTKTVNSEMESSLWSIQIMWPEYRLMICQYRQITWPKYRPMIGQFRSCGLNWIQAYDWSTVVHCTLGYFKRWKSKSWRRNWDTESFVFMAGEKFIKNTIFPAVTRLKWMIYSQNTSAVHWERLSAKMYKMTWF